MKMFTSLSLLFFRVVVPVVNIELISPEEAKTS